MTPRWWPLTAGADFPVQLIRQCRTGEAGDGGKTIWRLRKEFCGSPEANSNGSPQYPAVGQRRDLRNRRKRRKARETPRTKSRGPRPQCPADSSPVSGKIPRGFPELFTQWRKLRLVRKALCHAALGRMRFADVMHRSTPQTPHGTGVPRPSRPGAKSRRRRQHRQSGNSRNVTKSEYRNYSGRPFVTRPRGWFRFKLRLSPRISASNPAREKHSHPTSADRFAAAQRPIRFSPMVAPASAVISETSKGGETSTMSAPTMFSPVSPARIRSTR